jgi:hypothetical protein
MKSPELGGYQRCGQSCNEGYHGRSNRDPEGEHLNSSTRSRSETSVISLLPPYITSLICRGCRRRGRSDRKEQRASDAIAESAASPCRYNLTLVAAPAPSRPAIGGSQSNVAFCVARKTDLRGGEGALNRNGCWAAVLAPPAALYRARRPPPQAGEVKPCSRHASGMNRPRLLGAAEQGHALFAEHVPEPPERHQPQRSVSKSRGF